MHLDVSLSCSKFNNKNGWVPLTDEEFLDSNKDVLDDRDVIEIIEYIKDINDGVFRDQITSYLEGRVGKDRLEKLMLLV